MAFAGRWVALVLALMVSACGRDDAPAPRDAPRPIASVAPQESTAGLYKRLCAACHDTASTIAPYGDRFRQMRPEAVIEAMNGVMAQQASALTERQRIELAEYLTGQTIGAATDTPPIMCAEWQNRMDLNRPSRAPAGVTAAELPRLAVKWAFAFPGGTRVRARPAVAGGAVFIGSEDGTVYALDEGGGCVRWRFKADAEVRTAIVVSPWQAGDMAAVPSVYFGDDAGNAYRLDAATGHQLWKTRADSHADALVAGTPVLHEGRLYVPIASTEWVAAADPDHECCNFRGGVTALDAETGARVWQSWTIPREPRLTGATNAAGTPTWSPAGAPVWASPAVDAKRKRLYVATGAAYTSPASGASDAMIALDLETGKLVWRYQATPHDAWTLACAMKNKTNCPVENGPAAEFRAPPLLVPLPDGRDLVVAAQKSGDIHALDAQTGKLAWRQKIAAGGVTGAMMTEGGTLYAPVAGPGNPGVIALDPSSGRQVWRAEGPSMTAALAALPGAVLAGGRDGVLRAYDPATGLALWAFDTAVDVVTVNGTSAHGGSIDGGGPVVAYGKVFAASGSLQDGGTPGNVLIVLEPSWAAARPAASGAAAPIPEAPAPE